jgi:hypothetical protein
MYYSRVRSPKCDKEIFHGFEPHLGPAVKRQPGHGAHERAEDQGNLFR